MVSIVKTDITEIEYGIEAEGITVADINEIRLSIFVDDFIHSVRGKLDGSKVVFTLNPSLLSVREYSFAIEIITNYYFFKVLEDKINVTESNIKVKLIPTTQLKVTESKIQTPVVRLKL